MNTGSGKAQKGRGGRAGSVGSVAAEKRSRVARARKKEASLAARERTKEGRRRKKALGALEEAANGGGKSAAKATVAVKRRGRKIKEGVEGTAAMAKALPEERLEAGARSTSRSPEKDKVRKDGTGKAKAGKVGERKKKGGKRRAGGDGAGKRKAAPRSTGRRKVAAIHEGEVATASFKTETSRPAPDAGPERAKRRSPKNANPVRVTLLLTALLISLAALLWVYTGTGVLNVRKVEVRGNQMLDASYLRSLSGIGEDTHLLKMDVKAVEEALRSEPYVAGVRVRRRFPDTVILDVEERVPQGVFFQNGKYYFIDRQGVVLSSSERKPQGLLEIRGVEVPLLYPGQKIKGGSFAEIAELVAGIPAELRGMVGAAGYRPQCGLYLESGNTAIIYKDRSDLSRKSIIALLALKELAGHYRGVEYIDVSFPDHPVIKPLQ